ncbi:MAG TPA: hypothetical protein ENK31_04545 [Nannocystis exedens]|nr:hypothetical protein [Nannocystis exedens]
MTRPRSPAYKPQPPQRNTARSRRLGGVLVAALCAPLACATPTPSRASPVPSAAAETTDSTLFELPTWTNEGPPREVVRLTENSQLKVAAIALRRGTPLPTHSVDDPVTIHVLRGSGELLAGEERSQVAPGSIVFLGPEVPHALTPSDNEFVVLLVHYLKR